MTAAPSPADLGPRVRVPKDCSHPHLPASTSANPEQKVIHCLGSDQRLVLHAQPLESPLKMRQTTIQHGAWLSLNAHPPPPSNQLQEQHATCVRDRDLDTGEQTPPSAGCTLSHGDICRYGMASAMTHQPPLHTAAILAFSSSPHSLLVLRCHGHLYT